MKWGNSDYDAYPSCEFQVAFGNIVACTLEVSAKQSVYDNFPASSYVAYCLSLTNGHLSEQRSLQGLLHTQAAQQDCWEPCCVAQFGIGRNKEPGTFHWVCDR